MLFVFFNYTRKTKLTTVIFLDSLSKSLALFCNPFVSSNFINWDSTAPSNRMMKNESKFLDAQDWMGQISSIDNLQCDLSNFKLVKGDFSTYSITIYVDLPMDSNSNVLFDPNSFYAGHCFIELSKSNPYRMIRKVVGWYPDQGVMAISGIATKGLVVDDGGHEFQASYQIAVDSSQFEAAVQTLENYQNKNYHISLFNCVDFALGVFNAAGGALELSTRYHIPIVGSRNGDHTPNALFEKIEYMQRVGITGAIANSKKNYCLPVIRSHAESL